MQHCVEKDCNGTVNTKTIVTVKTGCLSYSTCHPCSICGRLHWKDGTGVFNRPGDRAFLDEHDRIIHKEPITA